MKAISILAVAALAMGACQPAAATVAPQAALDAAVVTPERLAALKTQVLTLVEADEDCVLPEGMAGERAAEGIDLGGGDAAVLVVCSTGTADLWSRIYVSDDGGEPMHVPLPLYRYQGAEGWQTWDAMSNMAWTAQDGFAGSTRLQATGCAQGATWRWSEGRLVLATQWHMDCDAIGPDGEQPDPIPDFPTTPPTKQPAVIAPQI